MLYIAPFQKYSLAEQPAKSTMARIANDRVQIKLSQ
jgi:hypothetical protein